jgi:hypothetical protein
MDLSVFARFLDVAMIPGVSVGFRCAGVRYGEDGVEEGGIVCCHGENDIPKRVGGFVDGGGHSAYMAGVSVEPESGEPVR